MGCVTSCSCRIASLDPASRANVTAAGRSRYYFRLAGGGGGGEGEVFCVAFANNVFMSKLGAHFTRV